MLAATKSNRGGPRKGGRVKERVVLSLYFRGGKQTLVRSVFIEPLWKQRQELRHLVDYPPDGYQFITQETSVETLANAFSRTNLAYYAHWALQRFLPVNLLKPFLDCFKKLPPGIDLTYAVLHPVFRREPWVLDMRLEQPHRLIGTESVFHRWKGLLKRALASSYCRKIIFELEAGKQAFLQLTGWHELETKMSVINSAVPPRPFTKSYPDREGSSIKLLFVNSANINVDKHFYAHGGSLILEVFSHLRQKYKNLELILRSNIPAKLKRDLRSLPGLRVIDQVIPWKALELEFLNADIFVYPTHVTPSSVLLDAMSYGLPVVTTDVWGNPEIVAHGRTGFLVHHPNASEFTDGFVVHFDSPAWERVVSFPPVDLAREMAEKVSILIENPDLRKMLGREGQQEVERGKFSIARRNASLKRLFDEALSS